MEKVFDEYGKEVQLNNESFKLVQQNSIIHDTKFESKATTFLKDAFKRFCKNKSSIVGAIIIAILMFLSIVVPIFSPHNVKADDSAVAKLRPRLFTSESGWWNGREVKTGVDWDFENETPAGHKKEGVIKILKEEDVVIDVANQYGFGGTYIVSADKQGAIFLQNYGLIDITSADNYKVKINMNDNGGSYKGFSLAEFRVLLTYDNDTVNLSSNDVKEFVVLKDWSKDYSELEFNLSNVVSGLAVEKIENCRVRIEMNQQDNNYKFFGVETIVFSCDSEDEEILVLLDEVSLKDANGAVSQQKNQLTGKFDNNYYMCNGIKGVANLVIRKVDFIYDKYEVVFGTVNKQIAKSEIEKYVSLGYLEYDFSKGVSSFKVLNEKKCPISKVLDQTTSSLPGLGDITYLQCEVLQYKEKGYSHMPRFIFGTDDAGHDLFTKCFTYLMKSLALGLVTSAICFSFGLCWGAISGYFGGAVDLIMERIREVISGVPSYIVMTLVLLLLAEKNVPIWLRLGIAVCMTGWISTAGMVRTQFYRFKGREYILASRTLGSSDMRLIFKHILPNSLGTVITASVLSVPGFIYTESSLAYYGLLKGSSSFGAIFVKNQIFLQTYPMLILFPSIIITLLMISFNLFGNGLRDALNPSLKGSE